MSLDDIEVMSEGEAGVVESSMMVIGVGGCGGNVTEYLYSKKRAGIRYYVVNTDQQALEQNTVPNRIQLGGITTEGFGAGAKPDLAKLAVEEDLDELSSVIDGIKILVLVAGMGKGTGTGATPKIAEIARSKGITTVGIVTHPAKFESKPIAERALKGIKELKKHVDSLIIVNNQKIFDSGVADNILDAYNAANEVFYSALESLADLLYRHAQINIDYNDFRTIINYGEGGFISIGHGSGSNAGQEAVHKAVKSAVACEGGLKQAKAVLLNVMVHQSHSQSIIDRISETVQSYIDQQLDEFIVGIDFHDDAEEVVVHIIASGIPIDMDGDSVTKSDTEHSPLTRRMNQSQGPLDHGYKSDSNVPRHSPFVPPVPLPSTSPQTRESARYLRHQNEVAATSTSQEPRVAVAQKPETSSGAFDVQNVKTPSFLRRRARATKDTSESSS